MSTLRGWRFIMQRYLTGASLSGTLAFAKISRAHEWYIIVYTEDILLVIEKPYP